MKDGKEINDKSEKNIESKPLIQNKNDDKEKIAIQSNQNIKKENEPKQSINKNNEKNIEVKLSDDDIDHPMPLETDYEEEEKDEIKNNFYQNQLKEKEKLEKIKEMKKKEEDNYSNEKNLKVVKKLEQSFNSVSKSIIKKKESKKKLNSSMNENKGKITKIKKMIPQKDIKARAAKKSEKKVEDKENMNDNTLNKKIVKIDIKPQKLRIENIEQNNIQKPNKNINQPKKTKKISRNQSFQQQNKINIIRQNNKSEDILNNQINNIPQQNINNNNTTSERLIAKIQNYMDYDKNIIYNKSINKTFKVEKPKYDEINFPNTEQNQRIEQIYYNDYDFENQLKENTQKKIVKMRLFKNRIGIKSQSYSNMNSNKICYNNIDKINNNIYIDEKMNTQTNINHKVSKKIPFQKINQSNKGMNGYKDKKIKRIPVLLNGQKNINNKVIKNDLKGNHSVDGYFINKNKSQDFKINKNKEINNIHNNVGFYNNDQRDYFKNDSSRKKTIETGGKFNNIQTTYVVISKSTNSKIKLIPKSNKTIDYGINKCLNPIHSVIFPKTTNYFNQQPTTYINSEENINNNQKIQFFSPYTKKQNYFQKDPSNNGFKTYKSQNIFQIKKNYCINEDIGKNYGNNYKNYVECSLHHNKMINNNQFMNNFYGTDKSIINSIDKCENYDYINYSCNALNNKFFSYY